MNATFRRFLGVSGLQPLSDTESAQLDAYLADVRDNVVPVIVKQVIEGEKRNVEARKLFFVR